MYTWCMRYLKDNKNLNDCRRVLIRYWIEYCPDYHLSGQTSVDVKAELLDEELTVTAVALAWRNNEALNKFRTKSNCTLNLLSQTRHLYMKYYEKCKDVQFIVWNDLKVSVS